MKKTAISLLLVLALVLCVVFVTAPTTQATDEFSHDDSPSTHDGWTPLTARCYHRSRQLLPHQHP